MFRKSSIRIGLILLVFMLIAAAVAYWEYMRVYVSTDDAYVDGHVGVISPRVSGQVNQVLVDNNYYVPPGQVLLTLDPRDFQVAVAQAEEAVNRIRQDWAQKYVQVATAQARLAQAEANFHLAQIDQRRYVSLYERKTVPKQTLDQVDTRFRVNQAEVERYQREHKQALTAIGGSTSIPLEEQPAIKEAKAQLEQARLNLGYTRVLAETPGYITRRQVQPGNWVKPGQPLMALVPLALDELWIQANFKETQLTHVFLGQHATVEVDTYPGAVLNGRVESIMAGTGAAFSLLPPENATGNWVKVVQRIPVKIILFPPFPNNQPLRLGMSVLVTIDTRNRSGHRLLQPQEH